MRIEGTQRDRDEVDSYLSRIQFLDTANLRLALERAFIAILLIGGCTSASAKIPYLNFDDAMDVSRYASVVQSVPHHNLYSFLKQLYLKNSPAVIQPSSMLKIPKIIHQIWLGGKLPVEFMAYRESWFTCHPDWIFVFWTDNPANYDQGELVRDFDELVARLKSPASKGKSFVVDVTHLSYDNKRFYDAAINYGERSDIIKWEVVYRFGGLYVDTDFECLASMEPLHYLYDFYTGIQPLEINSVQLGAALFAAIPGHPILQRCVETIKDNQQDQQIVDRTGPVHFTICFVRAAGRGMNDIAFPARYFYPLEPSDTDKLLSQEDVDAKKLAWTEQGALAIHFWSRSWMPTSERFNAFKKLKSKPFVVKPKILYTAALIDTNYETRKKEYIRSFEILAGYGYSNPYVVEAIKNERTFLNDYSDHICYSNVNDVRLRNKGVNEACSMIMAFKCFDLDDEDMIVKITGRYWFTSDSFLKFVENNPDGDAFVRLDSYGQVVTGCFALRYKYFKLFLAQLDFERMERKMINIEREAANYLVRLVRERSIKIFYMNHLDLDCRINNDATITHW